MLADTLERHSASLSEDSVAEYLKAGLALDSTNLRLRVFAEHHLGWNMQEVDRQIGEQSGLEVASDEHIAFENDSAERIVVPGMGKRAPIVLGKKDFGEISPEEMGAVIGFAKPERSAKS